MKSFSTGKFGGGGKFGIKVIGMPKVLRGLTKAQVDIATNVAMASKTIAARLEIKSKKLAKTGYYAPIYRTGFLYKNITGVASFASVTEIVIELGVNVYYGIYVHEGTVHMVARPFLMDAITQSEEEIKQTMRKAFGLM